MGSSPTSAFNGDKMSIILGIIITILSIFFLYIGIKVHKSYVEREGWKEWNSDDYGAVIIAFSILFLVIGIQILMGFC